MKRTDASIPRPARYLLRFDDLCPTVSREGWQRARALVEAFKIRPILGVVPDNQDPDLQRSPADPEFWASMRSMERAGAMIGLHGYRHLCASRGPGLVPLHRESEFAGVTADRQRAWIQEGLRILREHGLDPKIWVAPRHGFDRNTLAALHGEGIELLSDGFARRPFQRDGFIWIPQQLWAPAGKAEGLWTICFHPNSAGEAQFRQLHAFLRHAADRFTPIERALAEFEPGELSTAESARGRWSLWCVRASRIRKHLPNWLPARSLS